MNTENFIKEIKKTKEFKLFEDGMATVATAPGNVTANVSGYDTPKAFSDKDEEEHEKEVKKTAEVYGYKEVGKPKRKNFEGIEKKNNSSYKQYMKELNPISEVTYKNYRQDETRTVNQKLNHSIKEINRSIYEIAKIVEHASRLKLEMGVDQRTLWQASRARLHKIGERLNRIGKKINELGA